MIGNWLGVVAGGGGGGREKVCEGTQQKSR